MSEDATMLQAVDGDCCHVVLKGRITYANSRGLDEFIDSVSADPRVADIVVDLSEASYLDSTVLGLLAALATGLSAKNCRRAVLISTNEDVTILLTSIGFDSVFSIVGEPGDRTLEDLQPVAETVTDTRPSVHVLLKAHRALMDLSEENRDKFRNVVKCLEQEVHD